MIAFDQAGLRLPPGGALVLDGISFEVRPGELLALIGPSGSGKSVLLKAACGLLPLSAGIIRIGGSEIQGLDEAALFAVRARIGMLFQQGALFDALTVLDNVAFPLRRRGLPEDEAVDRALLEIERVGLSPAWNKLPSELSGGMRKRVGIARALVADPPVALFDEPTAGLDPVTGARILRLLRDACDQRGVAAIAVGHDVDTLLPASDNAAVLLEGRLVHHGASDEIVDEAEHPAVAQFVTGAREGPL